MLFMTTILTSCGSKYNGPTVIIKDAPVSIEAVKTASAITKGLSGRENLCPDCGMLFIFNDKQIRRFWMKEMKFSLDIIWIKDDKVVGIAEKVPLFDGNNQIGAVMSPISVNRVLEVNTGWAKSHGLQDGDRVEYENID
jgi:uncharacterized membrane protein (UPF0127 family)